MNSKFTAVFTVSVALGGFITGCGKKNDTIRIGQAAGLTGDTSTWDQPEKNALDMEIAKINEKGGVLGKKIELISYDTRANPTEAVNVAKRLVSDGVCAIIGPGQSGVAIAMTAVTEPAGVPFLATTATNPKVTVDDKTGKVRRTAFRTCFIDPFQGTVAAQFAARTLKARTAAIIYDVGSDYSSWLGKYFADEFKKQGGQVVANEAFRSGELDFRAILGKLKVAKPDLLFAPTMQKEGALIMKQANDLGLKFTAMGGDGWGSPDLVTLGGPAVNGSYFVSLTSLEDPDIKGFIQDYRAKYNCDPVLPNPVMAIDALDVILDAITKTGGTDPAKLIAQIEQTKGLQTLTGKFTFDPATHNPLNKPAIIQQVKDGKFVYVTKFVTE
ncbi:MAG: ABC transporter substrate-binding protein [Holophaga sp.]|jgi:branched-chain amino acid transport system substrate-binding protein